MHISRYVLFISILISATVAVAQKKVVKPATIKGVAFFEYTHYSFGLVEEKNGKVNTLFPFKNIGRGNVTILSVESGCGCTVTDWTKDPVAPGQSGRITVEFDPEGKEGNFSKTLTVKTDGDPAIMYLTITGEVYKDAMEVRNLFPYVQGHLRFSKYNLSIPSILESGVDSVLFSIYNSSKRDIIISKIVTPGHIKGRATQQIILPGNATDVIYVVDAKRINDVGPRTDETFIYTTDDTLPKKIVTLKTTIAQDFELATPEQKAHPPKLNWKAATFDFGEVYQGESVTHEFEYTNKGKSELIIRKADPACGCTVANASALPIKKGKTGKLKITFNAGTLRGHLEKQVTVYSNDPQQPISTLKIKAKVVIPGVDPISGK